MMRFSRNLKDLFFYVSPLQKVTFREGRGICGGACAACTPTYTPVLLLRVVFAVNSYVQRIPDTLGSAHLYEFTNIIYTSITVIGGFIIGYKVDKKIICPNLVVKRN